MGGKFSRAEQETSAGDKSPGALSRRLVVITTIFIIINNKILVKKVGRHHHYDQKLPC